MTDTTIPTKAQPELADEAATDETPDQAELRDMEFGGAAAFADAETREILNLLGDSATGSSCCGGSCCSA